MCRIDLCLNTIIRARGLCSMHYERYRKDGSLENYSRRGSSDRTKECNVLDCNALTRGQTYCPMHYYRITKYGEPEPLNIKRKKWRNARWIDKGGYVHVYSELHGKAIMEHRKVMEDFLQRSLFSNENVHHLNGVRDDNRLENLELWSKSQPAGQRVSDKVAWAKEILSFYDK